MRFALADVSSGAPASAQIASAWTSPEEDSSVPDLVQTFSLKTMQVGDLILPVFAVIVTGWLAGYLGYVARDLSDALIHFAYNAAMPALLIVTIAHEPARAPLAWRFLAAFGGGSLLCFAIVFVSLRAFGGQGIAGAAIQGWAASMTNTGFVALPVLQATYGAPAVLPAAIATVFVAVVMFPAAVLMQELDPHSSRASAF